MADHLLDPGTRAEPYERSYPGWVHDTADALSQAEQIARQCRAKAAATRNLREGDTSGTLSEAFDAAADAIEEAVGLVNARLDEQGFAS